MRITIVVVKRLAPYRGPGKERSSMVRHARTMAYSPPALLTSNSSLRRVISITAGAPH